MAVLKLKRDDEDKEIDFELDYLLSLTTRQRFEMMFAKTRELRRLLGQTKRDKNVTEVIKRNPD